MVVDGRTGVSAPAAVSSALLPCKPPLRFRDTRASRIPPAPLRGSVRSPLSRRNFIAGGFALVMTLVATPIANAATVTVAAAGDNALSMARHRAAEDLEAAA